MVEQKTTTNFIGLVSTVKKEDRDGDAQVCIHVQGMPVTDRELADLRCLQEEMAKRVDEILEGK